MSEDQLAEQIAAARTHVHAGWDEGRARRVLGQVERARSRRTALRAGGAVLAVAAAAAAAVVVVLEVRPGRAPAGGVVDQAFLAPVQLSDGSTAVPTGAGARMRVRAEPERDVFVLTSGGARVDVARAVRVEAGGAAVESRSAGARFVVEYEAGLVRVAAYRGDARVLFEATETFVRQGEVQTFAAHGELAVPPAGVGPGPCPAGEKCSWSEPREAAPSWERSGPQGTAVAEDRAERPGVNDRKVAAPSAAPSRPRAPELAPAGTGVPAAGGAIQAPARDRASEAFELADAARRENRPRDAIAPLRSIVERFPADPRAPLAAFTLGRVLLDDLGKPADAAAAFAEARTLAPAGPLAEDALAREVESWAAAGDAVRARAAAEKYGKLYPGGRRARFVRQLGGLE
jgi:transmembrane sensor